MRTFLLAVLLTFPFGVHGQESQPNLSPHATTDGSIDAESQKIIQLALTAFGGSQALQQVQNWTFNGQMTGPLANGPITYPLSWESTPVDTVHVHPRKGKRWLAPPMRSLFVPFILGRVLQNQLQDLRFSIHFVRTTQLNSIAVNVVTFSLAANPQTPPQIWWFDASTHLPIRVDFTLPAEFGSINSFSGPIELSDYRSVGGILYPFKVVTAIPGKPPEVIVLESVTQDSTPSTNQFNSIGGDLQ